MHKPRGDNDVISSADKPEIPVIVHYSSVSSDIKISSGCGICLFWIVLPIKDGIWGLVWPEQIGCDITPPRYPLSDFHNIVLREVGVF